MIAAFLAGRRPNVRSHSVCIECKRAGHVCVMVAHVFSLADVIELARALDRLPGRLTGFGIEGAGFAIGAGLSRQAAEAVDEATSLLLADIKAGA